MGYGVHFAPVTGPLRQLAGVLPTGTLRVSAGLAVLGLGSYLHLAIAGHSLSQAQMADLSVLWSIVYSIGLGLFFPIEQEVTRTAAARRVAGLGVAPLVRRGFLVALGVCAGVGALLAVGAPALAHRLLGGEAVLVVVTGAAIAAIAVYSPVRGVTAGTARFDLYGRQLGLDGILRIVLAAGLALWGPRSAAAFGLILTIAPAVATLAVARPVCRASAPGPPSTGRELGWAVLPLMASMLIGQFALNSAVVGARLVAPGRTALAAALLAALILIRIPVFVFAALQASLLSGLAAAAAVGDGPRVRRLVRHAAAVVSVLMVATGVPAVVVGPWLTRTLFAAPAGLGPADFAILSAATFAYLLALVLGQVAIALHRHRDQLVAWLSGAAALVVITALPGDVRLRVELAYAGATWVVVGVLAAVLVLRPELGTLTRSPLAVDKVAD